MPAFYNEKVFRENNIEIPKTYTELLEVCAALTAKSITPISLAGQFTVAVALPAFPLAASTVFVKDPDFAQKRLDGKTTFAENKQWKLALERYVEMNKKGCFGMDPVAEGFTPALDTFANNRAGMFVFLGPGGALINSMKRLNPALELSTFALPGGLKAADTRLPTGVGFVPVIPKGADEKKAAKTLIAFLVKNADRVAAAAGSGTLAGVLPDPSSEEGALIKDGRTVAFFDQFWPNGEVNAALMAGAQELLLGRKTPVEVLASMDTAFDL